MSDTQNDTKTECNSACCGTDTQDVTPTEATANWLGDSDGLNTELPAELQTAFGEFVGRESVETLDDWAGEIRAVTGGAITADKLCHTDEETGHWGEVDGQRYDFQCFYDAVILAAIEERAVDIHTESPDGTVIEARAVGSDELSVTPEDAVFSFGIGDDAVDLAGGDPSIEDGYAALCPYVRAFPDRAAYEAWAEDVAGVTVGLPLAGATEFAEALLG